MAMLLLIAPVGQLGGQGVYLRQGESEGVGVLFGPDRRCVVITLAHVVNDRQNVTLMRSSEAIVRTEATGSVSYSDSIKDLAAIRIHENTEQFCRKPAEWQSANAIQQAIESGAEGQIRTFDATGGWRGIRIHVVKAEERTLTIAVIEGASSLHRGMSGSPVYINGILVGLLSELNLSDGTGLVLRANRILQELPEGLIKRNWKPWAIGGSLATGLGVALLLLLGGEDEGGGPTTGGIILSVP